LPSRGPFWQTRAESIAASPLGLVALSLPPVTFRYKKELDSLGTPQFGLVAERVAKVEPDLVARDEAGQPYTVRSTRCCANEFLEEHRKVETLEEKVARLEATVEKQSALIEKVSMQV
jgi:hypothetical protein